MNDSIDIEYVARLARIALSAEEKRIFAEQLQQILGHVEKLAELDLEGVEATSHAFPMDNVWDEDEAREALSPEDALRNAPKVRDNQIVVPKVVADAEPA